MSSEPENRLPFYIFLCVIACIGAWAWRNSEEVKKSIRRVFPSIPVTSPGSSSPGQPGYNGPGSDQLPSSVPQSPPFVSQLPPPAPSGQPQYAPPGTFYMIDRVVVTNRHGVQAARPGELVKLLERRSDGKLRVTIDGIDFVVKKDQVTDSVEEARSAENRYVRGGGR